MNCKVNFVPVEMRLPLKFGGETIYSIQIASVSLENYGAVGHGETPLSVGWAWPADLTFKYREEMMCKFGEYIAENLVYTDEHPMIAGYKVINNGLPRWLESFNSENGCEMPYLAALITLSAFDIALHDAYALANNVPVYEIYGRKFMPRDLEYFFNDPVFARKYPEDYFIKDINSKLTVWHLVGGKDLLTDAERTGSEPDDGYPVTLEEWIEADGLFCLKVKLTGNDRAWDLQRMLNVGKIADKYGVKYLSPDFNCLVKDPEYVNSILDELKETAPDVFEKLLYVEQPFPYDLEANKIDIHSVSSRKPVFMDESAHDWKFVRLGYQLGWTGVALKVCKSQTGALLSACWAKENNMQLMVQDLSNPTMAMIPHVRLAQYIGTIMGVECNAPQFYPEVSKEFAVQHPYLYKRNNGVVDLSTLSSIGLGYTL